MIIRRTNLRQNLPNIKDVKRKMLEDGEVSNENWKDIFVTTMSIVRNFKMYNSKNVGARTFLEFVGIAGERGIVFDDCNELISDYAMNYIVKEGMLFQSNAIRQQIAELIGDREDITNKKYLLELIKDKNCHVRKCALLSLFKISPKFSERYFYQNLSSVDDQLRLFSIRMLRRMSSRYLKKLVDKKMSNEYEHITREVDEVRKILSFCNEDFIDDVFFRDGNMRQFFVHDINDREWNRFFQYLVHEGYRVRFFKDGNVSEVDNFFDVENVFDNIDSKIPYVEIYINNIIVQCHFTDRENMELNIDPNIINNWMDAFSVLNFMLYISYVLEKECVLLHESLKYVPLVKCYGGKIDYINGSIL